MGPGQFSSAHGTQAVLLCSRRGREYSVHHEDCIATRWAAPTLTHPPSGMASERGRPCRVFSTISRALCASRWRGTPPLLVARSPPPSPRKGTTSSSPALVAVPAAPQRLSQPAFVNARREPSAHAPAPSDVCLLRTCRAFTQRSLCRLSPRKCRLSFSDLADT